MMFSKIEERKLKTAIQLGIIADLMKDEENEAIKKTKKRWSRDWLHLGSLNLLHNELQQEDLYCFKNFLRMDERCFSKLLQLVIPTIAKQDTNMRMSISAKDRLSLTLRFLATGETYRSLHISTRISESSISRIVPEVCEAIWNCLKKDYMKVPNTPQQWEKIAKGFFKRWNVPNTIGAMDGKHVAFAAPHCEGSKYYNYKGWDSIVLLGLVDHDYKFIYVDVGCNGRISDGGVFLRCDLAAAVKRNTLNIPAPKPLPGLTEPVPYVIICDDAFHLDTHTLKPYPFRGLTEEQRIYNYRISRARCVVENAFGILANRFRIFLTTIHLPPDKVVTVTLAACVLHNFLKEEMSDSFHALVDGETKDGVVTPGAWRSASTFQHCLPPNRGRAAVEPLRVRDIFKTYFTTCGKLEWQNKVIYGSRGVILNNTLHN